MQRTFVRRAGALALAAPVLLLPAAAGRAAAKPQAGGRGTAHAPIVRMVTNKGTILIKLFPQDAPITCANFEKLIKRGFYNGLTFHRYEPGFVIQGGDPQGNGTGGPGYNIKGEFKANGVMNPLTHGTGAVAMARSGNQTSGFDTAGSQFYITLAPAHFLDGQYAVFGQVIKGMDVAENLRAGDKMTKVTVSP